MGRQLEKNKYAMQCCVVVEKSDKKVEKIKHES